MYILIAFYRGDVVHPESYTLDGILAEDDYWLEAKHNYIQWLFPLPEPSRAVPNSPVMTPEELTVLRASEQARSRILASAERMLRFYAASRGWLMGHDHNHLRITRIIRSLRLIVGDKPADEFRAAILAQVKEAGAPISASTIVYWNSV